MRIIVSLKKAAGIKHPFFLIKNRVWDGWLPPRGCTLGGIRIPTSIQVDNTIFNIAIATVDSPMMLFLY